MGIAESDIPAFSRLLNEALALDVTALDRWFENLGEFDRHLAPRLRQVLATSRSNDTSDLLPSLPGLLGPDGNSGGIAGDRVGPFRLLREIGRGGMGAVWLAERADGHYERQVAIKLPRIAWDERLAQRMARERAIVALLEHPNIARLYDAGADQLGRPYLAMEFIDGRPIDKWCRDGDASLRDRLGLIVQVARALSYAHGRLVVHRDIKPSNVLVSPNGSTYLVDFGIAKVLGDSLDYQVADLTQDHGQVMTLRYAAPEQISGGAITVASDVYSLGALMYELLTGACPHVPSRDTVGAMEAAILAGDPPLASSRCSDATRAKALRGELDAIIAKALKRDPAQRYVSADAIAADIDRYLVGGIVLAQPDSLLYRTAKTMRRHRLAIATASSVAIAILVGAGLSLIQAQRAGAEAERARLVKEFVIDLFNAEADNEGLAGRTPGPSMLEKSARLIEKKFVGQPMLQAELFESVGEMLHRFTNLETAADYAARGIAALKVAHADPHRIAEAQLRLVELLIPLDRKIELETQAREALEHSRGDPNLMARSHARLADALLFGSRDLPRAARELDAADDVVMQGEVSTLSRATVAFSHANWYGFSEMPDKARQKFDETIALGKKAQGPRSRIAYEAELEKAKILIFLGQPEAGKPALDHGLATLREVGGVDDVNAALWEAYGATWLFFADAIPYASASDALKRSLASLQKQIRWSPDLQIARVKTRMGYIATRWGDIESGLPMVLKNASAQSRTNEPGLTQWWLNKNLATALMESDRADEAPAMVREMLALQKSWQAPKDVEATYDLLVSAYVHAARYDLADKALAEYQALRGVPFKPEPRTNATPHESRLLLLLQQGRYIELIAITDQLRQKPGVHADEVAWLVRAAALCGTSRSSEAFALFDEWLPRLATDRFEASPHVAFWRARQGLCALSAGDRRLAVEASALASAAIKRQPGVSRHYVLPVEQLQQSLSGTR